MSLLSMLSSLKKKLFAGPPPERLEESPQAQSDVEEGDAIALATRATEIAPAGNESDLDNLDSGIAGIAASRFGLSSRLAIKLVLLGAAGNSLVLYWINKWPPQLDNAGDLQSLLTWIFVLNGVLLAAASYFFGRQIAARAKSVAESLERTQAGDYRLRLKPGANDELGMLSRRANLLSSSAEVREKRITDSALTDSLTGLPNRALLTNRLEQAIKIAERGRHNFAVALIDLDRFKWVNDTLGHDAGDVLLIEVARRLKAAVRTSDTVARLGGDEFVLLMSGGQDAANAVARHVLEAMKTPARLQSQMVDIGMSIGIAVYPQHGSDTLALMRHADAAMYSAKRQQAGRSVYEGSTRTDRPSPNALSMLGEMRAALEKKQFFLEYQPKLDLNTGLIKSLEGLVRWQHPKKGRIPPNEFIPLAEQTGFMRELTAWVVADGGRFAARLSREQLDTRVSVNVSAQDIESPQFAESIRKILAKERLDPKRLCLEITESGVLSETENAMNNLKAIALLGVTLSVDDFGTGYASLSQLQSLPVTELKIDRSFVSGMHMNQGNATIVRSTIDMGRQLGLSVVAEGVESVEELRALAKMGCDEAQGYYLSKPLAAADVIDWIKMRHALHDNSRDEYFRMLISP
ncbi:MAG: putative bifunctional diguanylate cyclase/phosphodiesterase [Burkholderiaceae bacterium]